MKFNKIYGLFAAAALFLSSCGSTVLDNEPDFTAPRAISISDVKLEGFASDPASRTAYTETFATEFEEGDRLGLVLVGADGKQMANVPFTRTADGAWNNDLSQLYTSDVAAAVAYFPFNPALPATAASAADIKAATSVALDQSAIGDFTASDLLVCELSRPGAEISISFSHAFSMLRFSSKATVSAGNREFEYSVALDGLTVSVGADSYSPCFIDGSYIMIVRDATSLQPELFKYTYRRFGEDRATKTVTKALTTAPGTAFSFPCPPAGDGSVSLSCGDFYCVTEDDGATVVIPAGAAQMPAGLVCQGIVFHVMDNAEFNTFAADNGLVAAEYPGLSGKHGLIVSLKPGGVLLSGYNPGVIDNAEFLQGVFADFPESGNTEVSQGLRLTSMLASAYAGGNAGVTFTGLEGFDAPLTYCTGWYIPSFNELKYLIRGDGNPAVASLDGQDMVNAQLTSVSGTLLEGNQPSVSFRQPDGFCIMQNGEEMGWHGVPDGEKCRPVCAF